VNLIRDQVSLSSLRGEKPLIHDGASSNVEHGLFMFSQGIEAPEPFAERGTCRLVVCEAGNGA
jgi:hypothetical protein